MLLIKKTFSLNNKLYFYIRKSYFQKFKKVLVIFIKVFLFFTQANLRTKAKKTIESTIKATKISIEVKILVISFIANYAKDINIEYRFCN